MTRPAVSSCDTERKVNDLFETLRVGHWHSPARPGECQELSGEYKSWITSPIWRVRFSYPEYIIQNILLSTLK